jgi:hypothetical protein
LPFPGSLLVCLGDCCAALLVRQGERQDVTHFYAGSERVQAWIAITSFGKEAGFSTALRSGRNDVF